MKINLKLRLKNKVTLISLIGFTITFIYQVLGLFDIVPAISQDMITQFFGIAIDILCAVGILVDPTTAGIKDSEQAMLYTEPKKGEK